MCSDLYENKTNRDKSDKKSFKIRDKRKIKEIVKKIVKKSYLLFFFSFLKNLPFKKLTFYKLYNQTEVYFSFGLI